MVHNRKVAYKHIYWKLLFSVWQLLRSKAQNSHLSSRVCQIALEDSTPYCLSYSRGAFSLLCTPGLQKVGKNNIVGQQDVWDKNLSIIQTNYIIKAVKNEKITK
jgi:hypothetical protein